MSLKMAAVHNSFSPCQTQSVEHSPTATPHHTRAGSPVRGMSLNHTQKEATETIAALNALIVSSGGLTEKKKMLRVGFVDGSSNVSFTTKLKFLMIYFIFNLGLTLYNKAIMIQFPFPFLLTALHAAAGCIGTMTLASRGTFTIKPLTKKESATLFAFSLLYTANIAISNVSLAMVTLPFHQVVRATAPVFTVAIYRIFFSNVYGLSTYLSLIPVILGVGLATYGDYYATVLGFYMTLLGAILAAIKTVVTNRMQTAGLHLTALEILYRLSPLAVAQSLFVGYMNGEISAFWEFACQPGNFDSKAIMILLINAAMAFGLNLTSFTANKKAGALTMTVAANVKQILTILLSIAFWHLEVGWVNALGIMVTLLGSAWYGRVELIGGKGGIASIAAPDLEQGKTESV